jgi:hypothetical protein
MSRNSKLINLFLVGLALSVATLASAGGFVDVWGPRYTYEADVASQSNWVEPPTAGNATSSIRRWNLVAMDANAIDHTPPAPDESRIFGEQLGPARTSLAFAIIHIAIFDAVNAIAGGYQSYTGLDPVWSKTSTGAAVAQAAHDTLAAMFPSQTSRFDQLLSEDLGGIPDDAAKANGIDLGQRAAAAILALRADDGSDRPEPQIGIDFMTSNKPGKWRRDPVSLSPLALGAFWGEVRPLVLSSASQFRVNPPPALTSDSYTRAFNEVKLLGGDGVTTPTERTLDQTIAGIY